MTQLTLLQLDQITKQFAPAAPAAVCAVTLHLQSGELLALLGPSGCGKTTLLRLIAGFERPQSGTMTLAGQLVAGAGQWLPPERRDVGMVFQDYALFPHLTVAENVAFGLTSPRRRRFSASQAQSLLQEAIALVGLQGLERRYPHQLSGGQQQRVALARALAPQPALVLLDEPLSNLDVQVRLRLRQEIREILKTIGMSGVFVTHDQEEALSIADQVAVMHQGQIEQFGPPEVLYGNPATRFVAEFVTQANFVPAQWNGQTWETELGCFAKESVLPLDAAALPDTGELMLRQEDLQLQPDERGLLRVHDRQFLGREHRYDLISPSGKRLSARLPASLSLPIGSRVNLGLLPAHVRLFPAAIKAAID